MGIEIPVATSFAVSFGLIVDLVLQIPIAMGIIIIHTFLLMGDIRTWCPDSPKGTVISEQSGAVWGLMVVASLCHRLQIFSPYYL